MELAFTGTYLGMVFTIIFLAITGLIFYFRKNLNSYRADELRQNHHSDRGAELLSGRAKFPEADGFRLSGSFLKVGLLTSVIFMLLAFNWTTYPREIYNPYDALDVGEIIDVAPPPVINLPPPPPPLVIEKIVEKLIEQDQPEFVDQSLDKETEVTAPSMPTTLPQLPPPAPPDNEVIFVIVEDMPRFPGCEDLAGKKEKEECAQNKLLEFIYAHIKYPLIAREIGLEGTVVVTFVVETDGSVNDIKVMRDIGAGCGDEAMRVVELMNKKSLQWAPGKQRGKAVRIQFNLPVKFKLQ